jgi:translocation and assembly module TamB
MALAPSALARQLPDAGRLTVRAGGAGAPGRWTRWRWDGEAQGSDLKSPAWHLGRAQVRWRFAPAPDAPLELSLHAEALAIGPQSVDRLQASASGSTGSHRLQLQADSAARPPAWTDLLVPAGARPGSVLRAQGQGGWRADAKGGGRWSGALERLRAGPPGAETAWLQADQLRAAVDFDAQGAFSGVAAEPGRLLLLGAALRWSELRWLAGGEAGLPRLDVQAELEPLRVSPLLAAFQPDFGWGGDLVVRGKAQVHTRDAFAADVVLERVAGDLSVTDEGGSHALGLSDLRLGWVANQGTWHFSQAVAGTQLGVLGGAQSLRLSPRAVWPTPQTPLEGVLELRVDNLGVWGAWTPPGWRLSGSLHVSASLGGRFKAPEYTGRLQARELGVRNLLLGVNARDGDVQVALKGPTAQIERFVMKGGDGQLQLQGGASFGDAPRAQLKLDARRFQVLGRVDRRIVASGAAEMRLEPEAVQLSGKVRVDEGLIDFSRADAPSLDEDVTVVRRVNGRRVTTSSEEPAPEPAAPERPARKPRDVRAALDVDLGEQLHIRGRGLDAFLRGQLRVTTPNNRLAVNGSVRTENGTYAAYGQKLVIERGAVTFLGPVENPRLDILALRPNLDIRVGVAVGGTALRPRVRLYSEPPMSDSDKLSWLVLGREPEGLGGADTALLQRAAMALLAGEEGGSGDKVIKALGLDDFSVRQEGEGELRNTVVGIGKQVSRRWYVGYERGINSTVGTWQAIYRIAQRFTLRGQAGEDNGVDLIWTWRWN